MEEPARPQPTADEIGGKSIVLFSDGTGNSSAKLFKTNVWRMYEAVDLGPPSSGKRKQIAFYDNGVGTSALRPLAMLGGIFGFGLRRNILEIYSYACRNYRPAEGQRPGQEPLPGGDDIYGFGFSRGAFTMRLVVALIATQGLVVAPDETSLARMSRDAYRAFRADFLPRRFALPTLLWRTARKRISDAWRGMRGLETYDAARNHRPTIRFVGAWDTVAAYGGPSVEIVRGIDDWLYALSMPDYCLHPRVQRARHALAIDDARDAFHPLLWDEVNEDALVAAGTVPADRLEQVWFTGMHADVGGGYPDESLSYVSFLWMLGEAEAAGLRTLSVITDRFRALANSAGPLHDSRSGFASYYRYQPRNIGAWTHPADAESIVADPELKDAEGRPKGLLTRVRVHESVLARIVNGTDGYAPFTLPGDILVSPPEAAGETAVQADNQTRKAPPAGTQQPRPMIDQALRARSEDKTRGAARAAALGAAWDLVWLRRIGYFCTLGLTALLVLMPGWIGLAPEPPFLADGRTWAGAVIRMASIATPDFLDPLINTMADNSFYLLTLLILIFALMRWSASLERRLNDRSRAIWQQALAPQPANPVTSAGPGDRKVSLIETIRTSRLYRRPIRFLKWRIMPFLAAVLIMVVLGWLAAGLYTQVRLADLERGTALCRDDRAMAPIEEIAIDFSTAAICQGTGRTVEKGARYIVDFAVTRAWSDGGVPATPAGLDAARLGIAGLAGVPFRRLITANYLQPAIEIRRRSGRRVHIDPLTVKQQGDSPDLWRAEFIASHSGALALFANEAVPPFGAPSYFYDDAHHGNRGTARVVIRRADDHRATDRARP